MNDSLPTLPSDPDTLARHLINSAHLRDGLPEIVVGLLGFLLAAALWSSYLARHGSVAAKNISADPDRPHDPGRFALVGPVSHLAPQAIPRRSIRLCQAQAAPLACLHGCDHSSAGWSSLHSHRTYLLGRSDPTPGFGADWNSVWRTVDAVWTTARFLISGALMALSAVLLGLSTVQPLTAWAAFYAFTGVIFVTSGAAALRRFLRSTSEQSH